ncbi:MAG: sugar phosphate isomerase/epimerase [Rhodobacteraceae bacterium]|nr:sugar phosphate isomerase/epimerase [Paracoccaceae bacterium]
MIEFSYQLYSSRNFLPLSDTLKMLSAAGYTQVEGYGGLFASLDDIATLKADLDANGLHMTSGHIGLEALDNNVEANLAMAKTLAMEAIYCPYLAAEERPDTAAGWRAFGARLQAVSKPYVEAGLTFGWHNHDFEFVAMSDGQVPMDLIMEGGPDLTWEADIAWIIRGLSDPFTYIDKYASRISAVHVKDIAAEGGNPDEDGWADVGHGIVDWPRLMDALKASNAQHFVMEHDNPNDATRFATRSLAAAQKY